MNENKYTISAPSAVNVSAYCHNEELKFKKTKAAKFLYFLLYPCKMGKSLLSHSCSPKVK